MLMFILLSSSTTVDSGVKLAHFISAWNILSVVLCVCVFTLHVHVYVLIFMTVCMGVYTRRLLEAGV